MKKIMVIKAKAVSLFFLSLFLVSGFGFLRTETVFGAEEITGVKALPCGTFGDVDNDGGISLKDSVFLYDNMDGFALSNRGDVNNNGAIDFDDVVLINQYVEGTIQTFPVCSVNPTNLLRLITPNGGEKLNTREAYKITWTSSGIGNMDVILLWDDNQGSPSSKKLASVKADLGYYNWTVPASQALGTKYRIQISDASKQYVYKQGIEYDLSDSYFSVMDPTQNIKEGAMIRAKGDVDVYIVKYVGDKKFKRLILSPTVFSSYGHLRWENILDVDSAVVDSYVTASYVYLAGDSKIWKLEPQGDTGRKTDVSAASDYDRDSVYEINAVDRDSYITN